VTVIIETCGSAWVGSPARQPVIRPRKNKRGFDLISDMLPFGRLWYGEPDAVTNAIDYAKFCSRSHDAVIPVYDEAGNVIEDARARGPVQRVVSDLLKQLFRLALAGGRR
jgi:hypothetical protein